MEFQLFATNINAESLLRKPVHRQKENYFIIKSSKFTQKLETIEVCPQISLTGQVGFD